VPDSRQTLPELLDRLSAQVGDRPFLAVGDQRLAGAQFKARVQAVAAGLCAQGFAAGDRLAVHLHRCVDEAVVLLAAAVAGGIAVPVHPKLKDDQVTHVLADADPWAVVCSATKGALLRDPAQVYAGRRLFHVGAAPGGLRSQPLQQLAAGPLLPEPPAVTPSTPAILLYSSGSTGLPKGIVQDHGNLVLGAEIVAGYLGLSGSDHILAVLPFSFDYGLNQLLSAMWVGCRVTVAEHLGSSELAAQLRTVQPTGLAGVPSLWHEVCRGLAGGTLTPADAGSLRYVTNSGGRLPIDDVRTLRRLLPAVRVFSMYGLTEAFRSAWLDPAEIDRRPDSFGKALPGVELLLVDPDSGALLSGPATGELVHAGALVAHGYWRQPAATARRFRSDPRGHPGTVVYSGDLVRRDAEGLHYFEARRDRLLKVAGHRVSPDEVAQALQGFSGVGEVTVFGVDGGAQGHRIVLCVTGDTSDLGLPARIHRQCRSRLPHYMVPQAVHVLPALPHNANGKVDLIELQRRLGGCTGDR